MGFLPGGLRHDPGNAGAGMGVGTVAGDSLANTASAG